jgi:hypothetical protein
MVAKVLQMTACHLLIYFRMLRGDYELLLTRCEL